MDAPKKIFLQFADDEDELYANVRHRWLFSVIDDLDCEYYLNDDGVAIDYSDAKEWIGNDREAAIECERRADLFQEQEGWIQNAQYHSMGKANNN